MNVNKYTINYRISKTNLGVSSKIFYYCLPGLFEQLWVKALTVFYVFIMIPQRKNIAVLHPRFLEMWWAIKMMIHLSNELSLNNNVVFYTTIFNQSNFDCKFNFSIIEISSRFKVISLLKIAYKIKDYDIVFVWNSPMHFVWVLSKIIFRAKFMLIWWNHHYPWYYEKKHNTFLVSIKRFFEKLSIKYIDVLVANGLYIKESLLDIFRQSRQIKILHPVVSSVFASFTGSQSRQNEKIRLFTYSRWVTWKNISLIFKLFDTLNKEYDFDLIIWWEGNELDKYIKYYKKFSNIKFLGNISEKEILDNALKSDIFLFPSKIDSFWLSVLEMMFLSLPIVWLDFWWVSELVKNWKNGFLCKSDIDFIEKTKTLIRDSTLRKKMQTNSFDIARSNFSSDIFNRELEEIFS